MQNKLIAFSFILAFAFISDAYCQKQINSPYSRFNLGSLDPSGSFRSLSMGGTGVGMRDNNSVYFENPASYSSFDSISFLFDFGLDYGIMDLSLNKDKSRSEDMNFDHLLIGFPVARGWGVATGLFPVSNGYYNLSQTLKSGDVGYDPIIGEVTNSHKGDGGLNNFFIGTGVNILKNLSVGVNFNVLFGGLNRVNQFEFADFANTFGQYNSEQLKINGINFDYGVQYSYYSKKNYFITAGVSFTASKKYHSDFMRISERFAAYSASAYSPDTVTYSLSGSNDSTRLPSTLKAGISFGKKDKFVVGIDYVTSNWASARIQGPKGYLANSKSWLFGAELTPNKLSNTSYLARMDYRIGGHISDNYLLINGVQIKEYGASCGLGFRLKNYNSKLNIYFDYTRKNGNFSKGLQDENTYTIGISLNLYDNWFRKRIYD
jgi:hypothetical protein